MKNKALITAGFITAIAPVLYGCPGSNGDGEEDTWIQQKTIIAKNFAPANGYDCTYGINVAPSFHQSNILKCGKFDLNYEGSFIFPLIQAEYKKGSDFADRITYVDVPKGHPLEKLAYRETLSFIRDELIKTQKE